MNYKLISGVCAMDAKTFKNADTYDILHNAHGKIIDVDSQNELDAYDQVTLDKSMIDLKDTQTLQKLPVEVTVDREGHRELIGELSVKIKPNERKWFWIILTIALIVGGFSYFRQHQINSQNQTKIEQQSSQIADQQSQINAQKVSLADVKNQVKELKAAIEQYKADQDTQALTNKLQELQTQLQQEQANNQVTQKLIDKLVDAINQLLQNPQNVDSIMSSLHL